MSNTESNATQADDAIDPVVAMVLAHLWEAANDPAGKTWSLAKLSKRTQLAQSTLRRYLTSLTEAGLVTLTLDDAGLGSSTLTEFGRSVCADLFDADTANPVNAPSKADPSGKA
ncbi:MAG TPA: helix-turn-helix domain-containing protein [Pararobbsia sp.]|nr:helix-turn-helix domain-containing protein [Pararobbsia sp.]